MAQEISLRAQNGAKAKESSKISSRIDWLDYAKGIGIVLVVIGHTLRGLANASLIAESPAYLLVDRWIYSFHMPMFFFLSGLLLPKSLKKGVATVLTKKAKTILYPYLIWSLIQGLISLFLTKYSNSEFLLKDLLLIPVAPIYQFWFLYALFGSIIIVAIFMNAGLKVWQLFGFALLIDILLPQIKIFPVGIVLILSNLVFVVFGALFGAGDGLRQLNHWSLNLKASILISISSACALVLYQLVAVAIANPMSPNLQIVFGYLTALVGTVMVLTISFLMMRTSKFLHLKQLGRLSLEIFVAHTIASAGLRIVLHKFLGIEAFLPHLLLGIAVGIYIPILIRYWAEQVKFRYLFFYP